MRDDIDSDCEEDSKYNVLVVFRSRDPRCRILGTGTRARRSGRRILWVSELCRWNDRCQYMESSHRSPWDRQHVQVVPGRGGERIQMVRLQATHKRRNSFGFTFVYNLKECFHCQWKIACPPFKRTLERVYFLVSVTLILESLSWQH